MPVMDEFKEERARMKEKPLKAKLSYFWDYHKVHVIIISCVFLFAATLIHSIVTAKDTALWVALIDCNSNEATTEAYKAELTKLMGIDTSKEELNLDNSYTLTGMDSIDASSAEALSVRIMAGEIDVFVSHEDVFDRYVQNGIFRDIREVLSPEQLAYYQDSFYYVDYAIIESGAIYEQDFTQTQFVDNADHTTPEGMEKPMVAGIYVTGTEEFQGHYYFKNGQEVVFGIPYYSENTAYALQFLDNMSGRVE